MLLFSDIVERGNYYDIRSFPVANFRKHLQKHYKSSRIQHLFKAVGISFLSNSKTIRVHKFFIPELVYLLEKFNYPQKLISTIVNNTWIKSITESNIKDRIDMRLISKHMTAKLREHQAEFVKEYDKLKQRYNLNGYILSFDQGLGKTITALATMQALNKKSVIIIAPKSTLETVWIDHIHKFFKDKKKVFVVNTDQPLKTGYDFYLFNYESMEKIQPIVAELSKRGGDVGIVVDESHNFLRIDSNRTQALLRLRAELNCTDLLLMSGTPIKAVGTELIPMMMVLDPYFDQEALEIFKLSFGVNTNIATDVLRERLSIMMHRKVKGEVLDLPPKQELTIKVTIPNGDTYTVERVKAASRLFAEGRFEFHNAKMNEYVEKFTTVMDEIRSHPKIVGNADFVRYLSLVQLFRKKPVDLRDKQVAADVKWANDFEKNVLLQIMTNDQKKRFQESKSAVKYVHLKVRGEVIGQFMTGLRMEMTSALVEHAGLNEIIDEALKKTVIFTSYVDTVKNTGDYLKGVGYNPMVLHGTSDNDVKSALKKFIEEDAINPLISSIQMLVTGVTIVVANTMVFLNKPWRHVDYLQASDRIHRIGQDTECFIYTIILDTGDKDNLSTRMEDVMEWSRTLFTEIVNEKE